MIQVQNKKSCDQNPQQKTHKNSHMYNVTKSHDSDTTIQYKVIEFVSHNTSTFLQYNVMHFRYIFTTKTILRRYIHDTRKSFQDENRIYK